MRKYLFLLMAALVLVACGSKTVENREFKYDEDDYVKTYEEMHDKNFPTNIIISKHSYGISGANEKEATEFLDTAYKLLEYKSIDRMSESIKNNDENMNWFVKDEDITIIYSEDDDVSVTIVPYVPEDDEGTTNE